MAQVAWKKRLRLPSSFLTKYQFFGQSEYSFHLNVPVSVSQAVKAELVRDLSRVHCIWQILLVGEDQQNLRIN